MPKTILITGATDGIGLETAKQLSSQGHTLILHGRSPGKLAKAAQSAPGSQTVLADLSNLDDVTAMAVKIRELKPALDVIINNAGVYRTPTPRTPQGLDVRFVVNTLAPYMLTRLLTPVLSTTGRIVNLSSAAQAPVNFRALSGEIELSDMEAYAQSKLALTMWSMELGLKSPSHVYIAVNPGSLLGTKMVREGFGVAGGDIGIGADILIKAALSEAFADKSGQYFDNDAKRFSSPHPDGLDEEKRARLIEKLDDMTG